MEPSVDRERVREWLARRGLDAEEVPEIMWFGDDPEMARELGDLVRRGRKTATAGLAWSYDRLPEPGERWVVIDWEGRPLALIELTEVRVVPYEEVGQEFARDEGEGDLSLEHWRRVHWSFFTRECERLGRDPDPRMPVTCIRFHLLS